MFTGVNFNVQGNDVPHRGDIPLELVSVFEDRTAKVPDFGCHLYPMGMGPNTSRSPSCPATRPGSRRGPSNPRLGKGHPKPSVFFFIRGCFWAALVLDPHFGPVCHGRPHQGHKDNCAPGIIGTCNPLSHDKVVAQEWKQRSIEF